MGMEQGLANDHGDAGGWTLGALYTLQPQACQDRQGSRCSSHHQPSHVPRANVMTKQDVHNAIEVTMEQVAENILAPTMEVKIVIVTGQVETLQNKVDEMVKSFDTMQDSGEKWKEVVSRKVDKVANKVDRVTDANLVKAREANIRVTGLTMSKGKTSKQLMELVQTKLLDKLKVADRV